MKKVGLMRAGSSFIVIRDSRFGVRRSEFGGSRFGSIVHAASDSTCRSRLAGECGGAARKMSPDTPPSPASRLLRTCVRPGFSGRVETVIPGRSHIVGARLPANGLCQAMQRQQTDCIAGKRVPTGLIQAINPHCGQSCADHFNNSNPSTNDPLRGRNLPCRSPWGLPSA
jgi:hypothetical protein